MQRLWREVERLEFALVECGEARADLGLVVLADDGEFLEDDLAVELLRGPAAERARLGVEGEPLRGAPVVEDDGVGDEERQRAAVGDAVETAHVAKELDAEMVAVKRMGMRHKKKKN